MFLITLKLKKFNKTNLKITLPYKKHIIKTNSEFTSEFTTFDTFNTKYGLKSYYFKIFKKYLLKNSTADGIFDKCNGSLLKYDSKYSSNMPMIRY